MGEPADPTVAATAPNPGGWISERTVRYVVIGAVAVGVLLRLRVYLFNAPLWLDEVKLALDVLKAPIAPLEDHPGHAQLCALGFILLTKLAVRVFGDGEYALRLVPLVSAVIAFLPVYWLARRCLRPAGVAVAMVLFAVSPKVIRYAATFKPYSTDLVVAAALACMGVWALDRRLDAKRVALLAVAGAAAVWLSLTAVFVLAGVGLVLGGRALVRRRWGRAARLSAVGLIWAASFLAYFAFALGQTRRAPALLDYWESAFMPLPPTSLADLRWFATHGFAVFRDPGGLTLAGLAALAFAGGVISLWQRRRDHALALVAPIAVVLLASGRSLYPFASRLLLFVVPLLYVPIAEGADRITAALRERAAPIGVLFLVLLFAHPVVRAADNLVAPWTRHEIRPVLSHIAEHGRPGDAIYVHYAAMPAYAYYAPRLGLGDAAYVEGARPTRRQPEVAQHLERLRGIGRAWIVLCNASSPEQQALLRVLDGMGERLSHVAAPDAAAYLYDLGPAESRAAQSPQRP